MKHLFPICIFLLFLVSCSSIAKKDSINVIAYYSGNEQQIDEYDVSQLTHIIYSFCHLKGNRLNVDNAKDTATLHKLVSLKKQYPRLKVMLSLGGWGGCATCSDVFNTEEGRKEFAQSVEEINTYFNTDGLDFDWEYPTIEGHPGHPFRKEDKENFTDLIIRTREALGGTHELSFAAGGFTYFLKESVDWKALAPYIDRVNLMSYDLVSGYSKVTGHHTPLYSSDKTTESADNAIRYLDSIGFPLRKVVIGAAFYARTWTLDTASYSNGIYEKGVFTSAIKYADFVDKFPSDSNGFIYYFDSVTKAPFRYSPSQKVFATFDDSISIALKTKYAKEKGLNGIMFWELTLDKPRNGLLQVITDHK